MKESRIEVFLTASLQTETAQAPQTRVEAGPGRSWGSLPAVLGLACLWRHGVLVTHGLLGGALGRSRMFSLDLLPRCVQARPRERRRPERAGASSGRALGGFSMTLPGIPLRPTPGPAPAPAGVAAGVVVPPTPTAVALPASGAPQPPFRQRFPYSWWRSSQSSGYSSLRSCWSSSAAAFFRFACG